MDNLTKHKLKQQDRFVAGTGQGIEWAKENKSSAVGYVIALVVVILVGVGGYTLYQHRTEAASTAFGEAMTVYQTPIPTEGQQVPPGTKTFPDEKSRALAANPKFLDVAHRYNMTEPGKLALYFAGLTYMQAGQTASAEETLKKSAQSWNADVAASSKEALAELYQQTGRDADAIALYNELAKGHATTVGPFAAQIDLAELYESEGKTAEANKIYAEVKDKDKDAKGQAGPAGEIATQKLAPKK